MLQPATKRYKIDYQLFSYWQNFVSDTIVSALFGGKVKRCQGF